VKWVAGAACLLVSCFGAAIARAEPCHPPAGGSFRDEWLEKQYDAGAALVAEARQLEGERRSRVAQNAVQVLLEIQKRPKFHCLPSTVVLLGEALELQGEYKAAAEQYQRLVDARSLLLRDKLWARSLPTAEAGLARALGQTASVTLRLGKRDCAQRIPRATIDGASARFVTAERFNPGTYQLRVAAPGCVPFESSFAVVAGEDLLIPVDLSSPPPQSPPPPVGRFPAWVLYAAGAALAVGAGVTVYAVTRPSETPAPTFSCSSVSSASLGCARLQ
jgi:hypothetical protein